MVGRDQRPRPTQTQGFGDFNRERRALGGIRRGSELVQEDERMRIGGAENVADVDQGAGEGTEVLLKRLHVANVGPKGVKYRQLRAPGADREAALGHPGAMATVFSTTVLPPVLGPLTTSTRWLPSCRRKGITSLPWRRKAAASTGCRASTRSSSVSKAAGTAEKSRAKRALAASSSSTPTAATASSSAAALAPT